MEDLGQASEQNVVARISELLNKLHKSSSGVESKIYRIKENLLGQEPMAESSDKEKTIPTGLMGSWEMLIIDILMKVNRAHSDTISLTKKLGIKEVK